MKRYKIDYSKKPITQHIANSILVGAQMAFRVDKKYKLEIEFLGEYIALFSTDCDAFVGDLAFEMAKCNVSIYNVTGGGISQGE